MQTEQHTGFNIAEELKKLPRKPGVYIMKDASDHIIYVGKAINLRNRVRQYFQQSAAQSPKVRSMAPRIKTFEVIVVENELEALILECHLIKKHRPRYNVMLRDDKTYPYLKLTVNEPFPRLFVTRRHLKDKAKYFGPITSKMALDDAIETIHGIWPLRRCTKALTPGVVKERPCLNHAIGRCLAPCNGLVSEADYQAMVEEVLQFLNGKTAPILKKMEADMLAASENLDFEQAAILRDKMAALKRLEEKQNIERDADSDQDVLAVALPSDLDAQKDEHASQGQALVQVFFIRGGKMTGREQVMLNAVENLPKEGILAEFIKRFYSETSYIPREILLQVPVWEKDTLTAYLSHLKGHGVTLTVPQKGEKRRLIELAANNAALSLAQFGTHMAREAKRTVGALDEIRQALCTDNTLTRIEAYDISNSQGFESVGSMVVFENGKPKRNDYRKFKIKTVIGPDDYASMEEVLSRRLARYKAETDNPEATNAPKFSTLPDMIFIDGGVGQVHAAMKAMDKLGIHIPLCGMVKDDKHRTRGLLFEGEEIELPVNSEGFKLVTRIQDEVHRFAIEYHRKLSGKKQVKSVLDDIPGIGPVRRKALLRHFGDVYAIQAAEVEALAQVEGMDRRAAEGVYTFFRQLEKPSTGEDA